MAIVHLVRDLRLERRLAIEVRIPSSRRWSRPSAWPADFETSNAPDVRAYLVAAADVTDNETVTRAAFLELGPLKGNTGDQNYPVPATVRSRAVPIGHDLVPPLARELRDRAALGHCAPLNGPPTLDGCGHRDPDRRARLRLTS